jgi:hypothetical protein
LGLRIEQVRAPVSKDVKKMVADIRQALDAYPREQLQEILAYVFKEYVVEGGAPSTGALSMLDARSELEGLSFAELMTWLQLHLDVPELALFEIAGGRVHVRAGGRAIPLEGARAPEPLPAPPTVLAQPSAPQPMPPPQPTTAPTPSTVNPPPPAANAPASSQPKTQQPTTPEEKKDEAGAPASRFSWLEVD